jgi:hypothetical protein
VQGWVVTDGKNPPLKAEAFFPLPRRGFSQEIDYVAREYFTSNVFKRNRLDRRSSRSGAASFGSDG